MDVSIRDPETTPGQISRETCKIKKGLALMTASGCSDTEVISTCFLQCETSLMLVLLHILKQKQSRNTKIFLKKQKVKICNTKKKIENIAYNDC